MADWIDTYVAETDKMHSPAIYRLWAAITAVSGALERKVWTTGATRNIYPNMFTLLVGPPASGKTNAIVPIRTLWTKIPKIRLAPDNATKAALIDALVRSLQTVLNGSSTAYVFSALAVPISEFGVFFTHHDLEFLSVLSHIYDCPEHYQEERRSLGEIKIVKPYLTILAGTQPDFLNSFLPEEAWGQGFTSRLIMVYANKVPPADLFATTAQQSTTLPQQLARIADLKGEVRWTVTAMEAMNAWNAAGCPPAPTHSKLQHYNGRRIVHCVKLAMISAISRTRELIVHIEDVERAQSWLIEVEQHMPDIFRSMNQKSDIQVISDMHFHLYRKYSSVAIKDRKPLHTQDLYQFLHARVTSHSIASTIEVAEKSGYFTRGKFPDEWIPNTIERIYGSV